MSGAHTVSVEPVGSDAVAMVQCIAMDAMVFPYPSVEFGLGSGSRVMVARTDADPRVLGFLAARLRRGVLHIEGLAVDPDLRRRGIGRALVRAVLARARADLLCSVDLHVGIDNRPAVTLYEGEGFVIERRLRGFYPARAFGHPRDAYRMTFRL